MTGEALDFAGGTVVHITSGISALAILVFLGKRKGYGVDIIKPHNVTLTLIGTGLLWFGWFGFNAGSALAANEIAGLVAITAPCGSVENWAAIMIGLIAGAIVYAGVMFNEAVLKVNDPVGVIAVHGYCGTWGLLAVGIFSVGMGNGILDGAVYAAGAPGLLYGGVNQFIVQVVGALAAIIWAFVAGLIVFKLIDIVIGLRVSEREELEGLDITEHGIRAYPEYITE